MYKKIILSSIMMFLLLSGTAFAEDQNKFSGTSITDFTIYKIFPKKSPVEEKPVFNSETDSMKSVEKPVIETKTEVKKQPAPVKKVVKQQLKPEPAPTKAQSTPKPAPVKVQPVETKVEKQPDVKKVQKPQPEVSKKEDLSVKEEVVENEISESKPEKSEEKTGFDKDDYTKRLNDYLDQDSSKQGTVREVEEEINSYDYIVRPSISLGIVLLLIFTLAWIYAKVKGIQPNIGMLGKTGDIDLNKFKVLATSTLGQGKVIHLVEINGKQLVLGSTNNNISILTEISPEDMEGLQAKAQQSAERPPRFVQDKPQNKPPVKEEPEDVEYYDTDSYSARYSELYKEYIDKEEK